MSDEYVFDLSIDVAYDLVDSLDTFYSEAVLPFMNKDILIRPSKKKHCMNARRTVTVVSRLLFGMSYEDLARQLKQNHSSLVVSIQQFFAYASIYDSYERHFYNRLRGWFPKPLCIAGTIELAKIKTYLHLETPPYYFYFLPKDEQKEWLIQQRELAHRAHILDRRVNQSDKAAWPQLS